MAHVDYLCVHMGVAMGVMEGDYMGIQKKIDQYGRKENGGEKQKGRERKKGNDGRGKKMKG